MTQRQPPVGVSSSAEEEKDPAQIAKLEADIDQTRNAISGDLRTLGERLSPEHIKEEVKEVMTEAKNMAVETMHEAKNVATDTFREVKNDAVETVSAKVGEIRDNVRYVEHEAVGFVRDNAIPLALIGVGVAWFMSNRRSRNAEWEGAYSPRGHGQWRYPERSGSHPLDEARGGLSRTANSTRELGYRARDRARGWVEGAEREVNQVKGQVRDFAEREVQEVRGAARDAQQRLSHATHQARDYAGREIRQAWDYTRRTTDSHPLALAAGAVAAGVFVGLVLPETQRESELLGPQRARLLDEAKGAYHDAKDALGEVTHTAKATARDVKNSLNEAAG